jgi:hypothetical protein
VVNLFVSALIFTTIIVAVTDAIFFMLSGVEKQK